LGRRSTTPRETLTTVFTKEFLPEISFGRWRWQDSPAAPLTESDKQEMIQLIRQVHRVFKEKDVGGLTELMKLVSEEMARAMDIEEEELVMGQREFSRISLNPTGGE
jgi:hypothetical protein